MYYHVNFKAPSFVPMSLRVNRSIFLAQHCSAKIDGPSVKGIGGFSTHFKIFDTLKAAIGEHIERTSLYINSGNFKSEKCVAFNLITGEVIEVPTSRILLNFDSKIFKGKKINDDYNDSCGVASYLDSSSAITKAFLEFFERQSLIYNWLTQSEGSRIDTSRIDNPKLHSILKKTFHFIDELYIVDISIHPSINVALSLGIGEHYMGMGVSANWDLEKAVMDSIEEMFQCFSFLKNKHYTTHQDNLQNKQKLRSVDEYNPHYYADYFFTHFDPPKLRRAYSYLIDSSKIKKITDKRYIPKNFTERILQISRDLDLNIYACFIPTVKRGLKTKIVKVFSPEGYPHMNTKKINPMDYPITHSLGRTKFPNLYKPLPFP